MNRLPQYNGHNNYVWGDYKITKKSLQLSPIEKPDMSPFLVHMTGKDQILDILKSGSYDDYGLIRASIPSQSKSKWYKREVVCFTESVLHSIDSFRYIAHNRFQSNLFYGIGFSKDKMAIRDGIRPALYMDKKTIGKLASLDKYLQDLTENFTEENGMLKELLNELIPFITPVFQDVERQGYTWEREWRYYNANTTGFEFFYKDIAIICCPPSEKPAIEKQLGSYSRNIRFVSTWGEYNEVVDFMKSRQHNFTSGMYANTKKEQLSLRKQDVNRAKNQLEAYREYAESLANQITILEEHISNYEKELEDIDVALKEEAVRQEKIEKENADRQAILDSKCDDCGNDFEPQQRRTKYSKGLDFDRGLQPYVCRVCALRLGMNID
ncbi:hypothetical protein HX005_14090 [Acinetobacter sp. R933-2]|uniref:abortive infection system antitoxin AbiGi family protein n=1 Tax=Acinetobacter sp. R933-2 TaxID=2746728 RepID=UPI00257852F1|nr:abortive infection system antitoxin AbiGi family protein [Acinetobacter sp. R933-2]MDM1248521.1 hypothetical protein [Acinetobacter sp. R933-2]